MNIEDCIFVLSESTADEGQKDKNICWIYNDSAYDMSNSSFTYTASGCIIIL